MNYTRRAITKRRNALISRTSMLGNRATVSFKRIMFLAAITLIVVTGCLGVGSIRGVIDNAPNPEDVDIMPLGYATFLYDDSGNQIRKLAAPDANRLPVSLDQIPKNLQNAVVAIEDERFYEHNGIDVRGILRAAVRAVTNRSLSEGASTITQQLLKNNVFTDWTNESSLIERVTRKLQEQFLAVQIEKNHSKSMILENYLNTINLGAGAYGVQAAARQYFNKDVWELNLSECAVLASITQNPTQYNPIIYPEDNARRRKVVLKYMLEQGYIKKKEYNEALADNVYDRIAEAQLVTTATASKVYSYFEDELTDQVINDLMSIKGYTRTQAQNMLYSGGLKIMTTQDPGIQAILDEEYANEANYPSVVQYDLDYALTVEDKEGNQTNYSKEMLQLYFQNTDPSFDLLFDTQAEGQAAVDQYKAAILAGGDVSVVAERVNFAPQPQSSMSIIDQHTGYVKAIVGGRGEKTASLTLNRATDTTRQPGSTFKLVSTYAPALNEKGMTLATTFEDEPYFYPNGAPVNNAWMGFSGTTTIRKAIQNSVNVVAVKCLEVVTPELGLDYLDQFGFTTLAHGTEKDTDMYGNVYTDATLATALGGITRGVTNIELCAAYAAIANGGTYIKPIYYTKILDHNGNVLIENNSAGRQVIREATAWLLTSAMEDVVTKGTGTACRLDRMPVAGKTGTTENYNDLWFVGYTPYYTCAVWSGYDNNEPLPEYARTFHQNLWKKVMNRVNAGLETRDFTMPASVTVATVCEITGLLADDNCPAITEYFEGATLPTTYCYGHDYGYDEDLEDYYEYNEDGEESRDRNQSQTDSESGSNSESNSGENSDVQNIEVEENADNDWEVILEESGEY